MAQEEKHINAAHRALLFIWTLEGAGGVSCQSNLLKTGFVAS
jgi:hypothetical protein